MRQNTKDYAGAVQKNMKSEIRLLGLDDCPFQPGDKTVKIIGTFFRGGQWLDGVCSTEVEVDGDDATFQVLEMLRRSKFTPQLQAILLDGIAFGGFNVVNISSLAQRSGIPVIAVVRHMPDFENLETTLKKLDMEKKYKLMEKAGVPREVKVQGDAEKTGKTGEKRPEGSVYIQAAGISFAEAVKVIKLSCTRSYLPEPLRAAHLIAAGVTKGESKGRA